MKIYIAIFNKLSSIKEKGYFNLQLGAANADKIISEVRDDSGNNISKKNPNYCELTGLYWLWKNANDKVVGLTHYRRFFYKHSICLNKTNILSEEDINHTLNKYDIIVPQAGHLFKTTIYEQYKKAHDIEDLENCGKIIKDKYPEYYKTFENVIYSNHYFPYNMFICKKEIIDSYCEWLFSIFNELEKHIDIEKKDKYNKRVFGFLSERLFNVWIINNNYKVKEYPVYNIELPMWKQEIASVIKNIIF